MTSRAAPASDYYGERSERQAATARYTVYDEDHGDDDETGPEALAPVSVAAPPAAPPRRAARQQHQTSAHLSFWGQPQPAGAGHRRAERAM